MAKEIPVLLPLTTATVVMKYIRVLRGINVLTVIKGTPRPLERCVEIVVGNKALAGHDAPGLGRGLLCALHEPQGTHVVSVFRCWDGRLLYYDPTPRPVYTAFRAFVLHNDIEAPR